jgi:phosphoribosylamine---glycine ligase
MKVLIMDIEGGGTGINLGLRAQAADHQVRYWMPTRAGRPRPYGDGMLEKPDEWEPSMDWADLIVLTGNNKYSAPLNEYFGKGYPIFGANIKSAELELDRGKGQEILKRYGIKTIPYEVVASPEEGIALIKETGRAYAMKPWGGVEDCSLTYVSSAPDDGIFTLEKWKREGLFKGQLMMQEKIDGIEMGISGMFGPGGWSKALEESFEHKKFLNDDLGANTGEMGTVIRHVSKSKLFDLVLEPITDYLHSINYVGDCSVNCMVDKKGIAWPMEFTMRMGWPDFNIRQEVIESDPVQWMKDLIDGQDTLEVSTKIALGVVMAHGDFPHETTGPEPWCDYPVYGITEENFPHLHFQQVKKGKGFLWSGGKLSRPSMTLTAGVYVMVVTGSGRTVTGAAKAAYDRAWAVKWPSNIVMRTDIGKRLEDQLPELQKHGFAVGMNYGG